MRKAPEADADTVVFDLEDAVAPEQKAATRGAVNDVVTDPSFDPDCEVCVRINPDREVATEDIKGVAAGSPRIDSVMPPKVESAAGVHELTEPIETTDRLRSETEFARRLGYDGKTAIRPAQVGVINGAFTPDEGDVEWARNVLSAAEEAEASERGVFRVDGEMIDAPLISRAEEILERHRAATEK